jgi:cardiolipin synthase
MRTGGKRVLLWALVGAAVTLVAVLLFLNLSSGREGVRQRIRSEYPASSPQFVRTMSHLLGPSILEGNRITALHNGDRIFPAMLEAIASARRTITFETFIYWSGEVGLRFADSLGERARAGVRVHVLLDAVGTGRMDDALLDSMKSAGVEVVRYHPLRWYDLDRINNRTHRKLLVVDGRVGFTGGVGIADEWQGDAQDPQHWRDTHFRLEGPAVGQMQAAFLDNWMETQAEVLHGEAYFPPLSPAGGMPAQVFKSSPDEGSGSARLMYLLSIAAATRSVRIANAYFVPDDLSVETLVAARRRGVEVQIIVPGPHTDAAVVRRASRSLWGDLLHAGVEIYEFQPTMFHCKVMIVDGVWTSVGSTNFDDRSFQLNDEANLNVWDAGFAQEQEQVFERDLLRAKRVTLEAWQHRPWTEKVKERLAGLLRSQL